MNESESPFSFAKPTVDVVLVGCGLPKKSMGWYHATHILNGEVQSARLTHIVEPWLMGGGSNSPGVENFEKFRTEAEEKGVAFHSSLGTVPIAQQLRLAIISARTSSNPDLVQQAIKNGCTHILLEKPGASSSESLSKISEIAESSGVIVYMGYNKNVSKYVAEARAFEATQANATTTFIHNNDYTINELPECFERNSEGMLKNMLIHELALIVTYYGVRVDSIQEIITNDEFSEQLNLAGLRDFSKIEFTIKTTAGKTITVRGDRCGGTDSAAHVTVNGEVKFQCPMFDEQALEPAMQADPDIMPYFLTQHDDYVTLKERITQHILSKQNGSPAGVATIMIGVEALKVAEFLTPKLLNSVDQKS